MPNKNYTTGRNLEYKLRKELIKKGESVIRSSGSHTPIDILSFTTQGIYAYQVKTKPPSRKQAVQILNQMEEFTHHKAFCQIRVRIKDGWETWG